MSRKTPTEDLREVRREEFEDELPDTAQYVPEFDARWLEGLGVELVPWTFDEVPWTQRMKCRVGLHRGRIEVLGGEPCFYCSYCGETIR